MDGYIEGRFIHQVDPKDRYAVGDCRNDRQRRLLDFIVPIVHPDKPTRVTITIGNTIFGALDRGREVDWGIVFQDLVQRLAKGVGKPKSTPICPFLFHLYDGQGLLTGDEELDYQTAKKMVGYRITPDLDSQPRTDDDEAVPTLAPSPRPEPSSHTPNRRRKSTYRAPAGSPPVRSRGPSSPVPPEPRPRPQQPTPRLEAQPEGRQPVEEPGCVEKPFTAVAKSLWEARRPYESMEEVLEHIGSELGVRPNGIILTIWSLPKAWEMEELRARIAGLLKDNAGLRAQIEDRDRKVEEAEVRAATAAAVEERIRAKAECEKWHGVSRKFFDFVGFSSDVVTKAQLYDQYMKKSEAVSAPKVLRMLVDFSGRVENLLKKLWLLLQHDGRGQEAGPSERRSEPGLEAARVEPASPPASTPEAPATGGPSASTSRPEATQGEQEPAATLGIPDPTH